jgi:hypothetical protein
LELGALSEEAKGVPDEWSKVQVVSKYPIAIGLKFFMEVTR